MRIEIQKTSQSGEAKLLSKTIAQNYQDGK
jgi:hypothetical protein